MVAQLELESRWHFCHGILSPTCLPIPPLSDIWWVKWELNPHAIKTLVSKTKAYPYSAIDSFLIFPHWRISANRGRIIILFGVKGRDWTFDQCLIKTLLYRWATLTFLENEIGFEPMNTGVADQRLIRLATHSMYIKKWGIAFLYATPLTIRTYYSHPLRTWPLSHMRNGLTIYTNNCSFPMIISTFGCTERTVKRIVWRQNNDWIIS